MFKLILTFLTALSMENMEVGYSTQFAQIDPTTGERDKHAGGPSPCLGRLVRPTDDLIAHRTLPCGTEVKLTNIRTGKTTTTEVGERGPYGACIKEGWVYGTPCPPGFWRVKKTEDDPGRWRGSFDLTPRVGDDLDHDGFELVKMEIISHTEPQDPSQVASR